MESQLELNEFVHEHCIDIRSLWADRESPPFIGTCVVSGRPDVVVTECRALTHDGRLFAFTCSLEYFEC
jgi:hypothetical protein